MGMLTPAFPWCLDFFSFSLAPERSQSVSILLSSLAPGRIYTRHILGSFLSNVFLSNSRSHTGKRQDLAIGLFLPVFFRDHVGLSFGTICPRFFSESQNLFLAPAPYVSSFLWFAVVFSLRCLNLHLFDFR